MESDVDNIIAIKQLLSKSINLKYYDYIKTLIDKNVKDCNLLYTQVCYLIKLFLLNDYETYNNYNDYKFDEKFIRYCFRLIKTNGIDCKKDNGIDCKKDNNNNIYNRMYNFFIKFNENKNDDFKFVCPNNVNSIIHITDALSRDIQTNITNNVIINFYKYVKEYVKINIKLDFDVKIENSNISYSRIISSIYNDIINNTYYSDIKYHKWIDNHKKLIVPKINKNIYIIGLKDGLDNHKNIFIQFIEKYIKNNDELTFLINSNNDKKTAKLLKLILNGIILNTELNVKYRDWIDENLNKIINKFNETNCVDINEYLNKNPFDFIPYMLFINKNLELNKSKKNYQIIPLRTNMTPKFIPINTDSFVDLLDSKYLLNKIKNYYHNDSKKGLILFDTYFNFTSDYIKHIINKGYIFSGLIHTNGYEIIFIFNTKSYQEKKDNFHTCGKNERMFIKNSIKNLTDNEKQSFLINNEKNKKEKKEEKNKLLKEQKKTDNENQKKEKNKKMNSIKKLIDEIELNYNNNLTNLIDSYYKTLNSELNKIDKTKVENKEQMKLIVSKLKDKLDSDKAFLLHCYNRNINSCLDDYENNFDSNYDKIIKNGKEIEDKISSVNKSIKLKKNELKKLKKECKYKSENEYEIKNIKKIKSINKSININKTTQKSIKRLLNKITQNYKMFKFNDEKDASYKDYVDNIKLKLINLIKKIYLTEKCNTLNNYIKLMVNNDINNLKSIILEKSVSETNIFFNFCVKYASCDIFKNNVVLSNDILLKTTINGIIMIEKEKNKTNDYKNNYNNIINELKVQSNNLNKLIKEKNKNELMNLFKTKSGDYIQISILPLKKNY